MYSGGRFTESQAEWHGVLDMSNELRELRLSIGVGQRAFAALLSVPLETLRPYDSSRQPVPIPLLHRARAAVARHLRQSELLPLSQLATELHVHLRTLQAAARTGRLDAHFRVRSVFGRPIGLASREAGERFLATHYRRFGGQRACPPPLPMVPDDYDVRVRNLRGRLRLTQGELAHRIGAAGKAVIYQWESRKRKPSPVLWQRLLACQDVAARSKSVRH